MNKRKRTRLARRIGLTMLALVCLGSAVFGAASASGFVLGGKSARRGTGELVLYLSMMGVRLGDDVDRLHRILGAPKAVRNERNEITGSIRTDVYGKLAFSSYGGSILSMRTARRSIRTSSGIGVGTTHRRLRREFGGLSCYGSVCSIVAGGGVATIGKKVTSFWMGHGVVRMVSIGRVID